MKYFTIDELCKSATAKRLKIDNTPTDQIKQNLVALVDNVLDPLRQAWGSPIIVTSGYRCKALNKAVNGAINSQHCKGQAADIHTVSDTPAENQKLYQLIRELKLPVDQCINEYGYNWIHVSFAPKHRRQFFRIG